MRSRITLGIALLGLCLGAAALFAGATLADPGGPHGSILYVSNGTGTSTPPNQKHNCSTAAYTTIASGVAAAEAPGAKASTVVVCSGTYLEDVVISGTNGITVEGAGNPVINALGFNNGVQVLGSGTTVDGLTVEYATGEGILVGSTPGGGGTVSNVTISNNTVTDNDRGNPYGAPLSGDTASSYGQCNADPATPTEPGDCGEAIHLLSAENSTVTGNSITGNSGGILMTDENGPASGNTISSNDIISNALDCGITIAGHHLGTFGAHGAPITVAPSVGGVYGNTITDNTSENNGLAAQGGGILLATGVPGGAVYNNVVDGNTISGNGLAGVTVHAHSPAEDLNGNSITNNTIGTNNLDGDPDFFPSVDSSTTGVIVATASSPISITITGNTISYDNFGVWTTGPVTATISGNTYIGVTQDVGP